MRTYGEMKRDAQACRTKDEAHELVRNEVVSMVACSPLLMEDEARRLVLSNIGYLIGHCEPDEAERLFELFERGHPFREGLRLGISERTQAPKHLSTGGVQ